MKSRIHLKSVFALFVGLAVLAAAVGAWAEPWKFGVIADTQWTIGDDGKNPNTCAADIIRQVNRQFIAAGVKLVIHVGDMVNVGSSVNDFTRALYAQELYNAGIGFYPLRGNHEAANKNKYVGSGEDFRHAYPQIVPGPGAGVNNNTPGDITTALIPANDMDPAKGNPPAAKTRPDTFIIGTDFSAPEAVNRTTGGVSYSFRYNNATFVLVDQFKSPDYFTSYVTGQQPWIDKTLSGRPAQTHAFVFSHKNLLGGNHKDNLFGGPADKEDPGDGDGIDPGAKLPNDQGSVTTVAEKQAAMNGFLASLQGNNVRYAISGHDHNHYLSVVTSPDRRSTVHQLILQSDSTKFYTPRTPASRNDVPIEQDLERIGYYLFTVDGPRVTIDYYADDHGNWQSDGKFPDGDGPLVEGTTPAFRFVKRSTMGYSLNGREHLAARGESYAMADDTTLAASLGKGFNHTQMAILSGTNGSTAQTNYGKPMQKAVNTGWSPAEATLASDVLTLWGMADQGSDHADTFVLSLTYAGKARTKDGSFGLARRDAKGAWINAVKGNSGGKTTFVKGPWKDGYKLGTYGIDPATNTAWAVIDRDGEFTVTEFGGK